MATKQEIQEKEQEVDSLGFVRKAVKSSKAVMSSIESGAISLAIAADGLVSLAEKYAVEAEESAAKAVGKTVSKFNNDKQARINRLLN